MGNVGISVFYYCVFRLFQIVQLKWDTIIIIMLSLPETWIVFNIYRGSKESAMFQQ